MTTTVRVKQRDRSNFYSFRITGPKLIFKIILLINSIFISIPNPYFISRIRLLYRCKSSNFSYIVPENDNFSKEENATFNKMWVLALHLIIIIIMFYHTPNTKISERHAV